MELFLRQRGASRRIIDTGRKVESAEPTAFVSAPGGSKKKRVSNWMGYGCEAPAAVGPAAEYGSGFPTGPTETGSTTASTYAPDIRIPLLLVVPPPVPVAPTHTTLASTPAAFGQSLDLGRLLMGPCAVQVVGQPDQVLRLDMLLPQIRNWTKGGTGGATTGRGTGQDLLLLIRNRFVVP